MRPLLNSQAIADLVRELRHERGLSQEGLAARSGLHRTYIGFVERARRTPTLLVMDRILAALGCSWEVFGRALDERRTPLTRETQEGE